MGKPVRLRDAVRKMLQTVPNASCSDFEGADSDGGQRDALVERSARALKRNEVAVKSRLSAARDANTKVQWLCELRV